MSRPLRIQYPNAYYHVMNRGISRAEIFSIDDDYGMFLEALKESSKFFGIKVIAYCLMTNHYHLLIQTPKANLSRAMRHVGGIYTQRYNRLHKKDGPLFRGRYKAILIQEDEYLRHLVRYIHLNPVEANLVQDPKDYAWSSHSHYLKAKDEAWLFVRDTLGFFASKMPAAKKAYLEFIRDGIDPKTKVFFALKNQPSIFGDADFVEEIKERYLSGDSRPALKEIPQARQMHSDLVLSRIKRSVLGSFRITEAVLLSSKRGRMNEPRSFAIALAKELSGVTLPQIAAYFKAGSYKNVSAHYHRLMESLARDKKAADRYRKIKEEVSK